MNDKVYKFLKDPVKVSIPVSIISLGIGFGIGYFIAKRKRQVEIHVVPSVEKSFEGISMETITAVHEETTEKEEAKKHHPTANVKVDEAIEDEVEGFVTENFKKSLEWENSHTIEAVARNIFAHNDDWDQEEEEKLRTRDKPYIITKSEFWNEERRDEGYSQTTLTYYSGDDIMADQEEKPIYNHDSVVGPLMFGHGSDDANVFYVRNDKLKAEYEILRDSGMFAVEVMGLQNEPEQDETKGLRHSGPGKFRPE